MTNFMDLSSVMQELADRIDVIDGLNVYSTPPSSVVAPACIVNYPDQFIVSASYGYGLLEIATRIYVLASATDGPTTRNTLAEYVNPWGPKSVIKALDVYPGGDGTGYDACTVDKVTFGTVTVGAVEYVAAIIDVRLAGRNPEVEIY